MNFLTYLINYIKNNQQMMLCVLPALLCMQIGTLVKLNNQPIPDNTMLDAVLCLTIILNVIVGINNFETPEAIIAVLANKKGITLEREKLRVLIDLLIEYKTDLLVVYDKYSTAKIMEYIERYFHNQGASSSSSSSDVSPFDFAFSSNVMYNILMAIGLSILGFLAWFYLFNPKEQIPVKDNAIPIKTDEILYPFYESIVDYPEYLISLVISLLVILSWYLLKRKKR